MYAYECALWWAFPRLRINMRIHFRVFFVVCTVLHVRVCVCVHPRCTCSRCIWLKGVKYPAPICAQSCLHHVGLADGKLRKCKHVYTHTHIHTHTFTNPRWAGNCSGWLTVRADHGDPTREVCVEVQGICGMYAGMGMSCCEIHKERPKSDYQVTGRCLGLGYNVPPEWRAPSKSSSAI